MLRTLCEEFTNLKNEDIDKLEKIGGVLDYFCELSGADIFIDCFFKDKEMGIVVAHGRPKGNSQYKKNIVGETVLPENEPMVFFSKNSGTSIRDAKGVSQENKVVMQHTIPIKNSEGTVIGILIEERDMTKAVNKSKKIKALSKATEKLTETLLSLNNSDEIITNHISDGLVAFDQNLIATYVNPEAQRIYIELGFGPNVLGIGFEDLTFNKLEINRILAEEAASQEISIGDKNLIIKCCKSNRNSEYKLVTFIEDISDLKKKEKEIVETSIMVQEMHHRIKNNLQTISSILSMDARRSKHDETKEVLGENINRINSIAAMHEMMINSYDKPLCLMELLNKIILNIRGYALAGNRNISFSLIGDDITINPDIAISIAVVFNEIIHNAIAHGFHNREKGNIDVRVIRGSLYSVITVEDDGEGIGFDRKRGNNLGLDLVEMIVRDSLKGKIVIESNESGTKVTFDFKEKISI